MKRIITILIIVLVSSSSLTAQNSKTKKADKLFDRLEFVDAAEAYLNLALSDEANEYIYSRLAECYYNIFNTVEAERWYARALASSENPEHIYT